MSLSGENQRAQDLPHPGVAGKRAYDDSAPRPGLAGRGVGVEGSSLFLSGVSYSYPQLATHVSEAAIRSRRSTITSLLADYRSSVLGTM